MAERVKELQRCLPAACVECGEAGGVGGGGPLCLEIVGDTGNIEAVLGG